MVALSDASSYADIHVTRCAPIRSGSSYFIASLWKRFFRNSSSDSRACRFEKGEDVCVPRQFLPCEKRPMACGARF